MLLAPHLGAHGLGNPLDQELRLQSYLASQQNAELARQQQARLFAELANEHQAALANELRLRALAGGGGLPNNRADLTSRMLLAASQTPGPAGGSSPGSLPAPAPPAGAQQYDPELIQLLLERERQRQAQQQDRDRREE